MKQQTSMSPADWARLILLSVLWGGSFFFVEVAVRELPVFTVVVARVALAAAILWGYAALRGLPMPRRGAVWGAFFCMGVLNNVIPFSLFVWGQTQIASSLASILNATTPVFTLLVAHVFTTDERLVPAKIAGVCLGFGGVAVMLGGGAVAGEGHLAAQLACLAAALSYGLAGVYGRRFARMGLAPVATATGQVSASSLLLIPLWLWVDTPWTLDLPGPQTVAALAGLAALSTALAYFIYFRLLGSAGATNLLLVTFLIPVSATLLGVGVLGEVLALHHLAGMALIAAGLAAIDGRLPRRLRRLV